MALLAAADRPDGRSRFCDLHPEPGIRAGERVRRGSILEAGLAADRPRDMSLSSDYFRRTTGLDAPGCDQGLASFVRHRGVALEERFSPE